MYKLNKAPYPYACIDVVESDYYIYSSKTIAICKRHLNVVNTYANLIHLVRLCTN